MKKYPVILVLLITRMFSCQNENFLKDGLPEDSDSGLKSAGTGSNSSWPGVFDPAQVISLYFRMTTDDWNTVRFDVTNEILKKAWFRAAGKEEILVERRRKSSRALPRLTTIRLPGIENLPLKS